MSLRFSSRLSRYTTEESALYGTPDEILHKLETLRSHGIEQVLLNGPAGSLEHLRRFARDVMPAVQGGRRISAELNLAGQ